MRKLALPGAEGNRALLDRSNQSGVNPDQLTLRPYIMTGRSSPNSWADFSAVLALTP